MGPKPKRLVDRFDQTFFMGDLKCVPISPPSPELGLSSLPAASASTSRDYTPTGSCGARTTRPPSASTSSVPSWTSPTLSFAASTKRQSSSARRTSSTCRRRSPKSARCCCEASRSRRSLLRASKLSRTRCLRTSTRLSRMVVPSRTRKSCPRRPGRTTTRFRSSRLLRPSRLSTRQPLPPSTSRSSRATTFPRRTCRNSASPHRQSKVAKPRWTLCGKRRSASSRSSRATRLLPRWSTRSGRRTSVRGHSRAEEGPCRARRRDLGSAGFLLRLDRSCRTASRR